MRSKIIIPFIVFMGVIIFNFFPFTNTKINTSTPDNKYEIEIDNEGEMQVVGEIDVEHIYSGYKHYIEYDYDSQGHSTIKINNDKLIVYCFETIITSLKITNQELYLSYSVVSDLKTIVSVDVGDNNYIFTIGFNINL